MTQQPALHGLLIFAPDLAEGLAFYQDVLGLQVTRKAESYVAMHGAGFALTLFKCDTAGSPEGYSSRAGSSIAFAVDDIERSMAELRGRGVEFLHAVPSTGPAGRYAAFVDPFGTVHELVETAADYGARAV